MSKWIKHLCLTILLLGVCVMPVSAYVEIVEQDDSYFVTDEAKVLDSATEEYIVSKNQLLNETSGAAIVVVTVKMLNADIVDYAYTLFNEWQLGDETLNNGILLLISSGDQDYYCMVGRGLENRLSADELQSILDEDLEPDFAAGNIQAGVRKVFDTLYQRCVHLYNVDENANQPVGPSEILGSVSDFFVLLETMVVMFLIVTFLVILLSTQIRNRTRRPYVRPTVIVPPVVRPHRHVYYHRPSYPSTHHTLNRPASHSPSRSSSFTTRSSSSFRARSGGSTRGAGAGRRR